MNRPSYIVEIDRLVLDGFDLSREQAERVRGLVVGELQRRLAQEKPPGTGREVVHRFTAPLAWQPSHGEHALATGIARQVAPVVQGQIQQRG